MAGENTVATLDGLFKKQFHSDVENLLPDHVLLQKGLIDWVPADKENGQFYEVPTLLRSNQGVTYLGESGGVGTLKSAKNAVMKPAQIYGSEINIRGQLSYKALSQAAEKGAKAFKKSSAWPVEDLAQVAHTRLEIAALYGRDSLGVVESATNVSGSTWDIVITEETFAPGIWVLLEGAVLEYYDVSDTAMGSSTSFEITTVTTSTRTIRATKTGADTLANPDTLHFEGARTGTSAWNEMVGLYTQFTDASSTLFALDRSAYSLIKGNTYSSTGRISKAKIVDAAMRCVDKGCMSELVCLVSTKAWAALWAEDAALRIFDGSYSKEKAQSGSKELVYQSVNGGIKVVCHPMVKYGQAMIFNPDEVIFVGSSKPTFEVPGFGGEKFFRLVENSNAVELQNFADMAVYCLKPSQAIVMTGITYS